MSVIKRYFAGLFGLLLLPPAVSAQVPFTIDANTWPDQKAINLVIPDSGLIPIQLLRTNSTSSTNVLELRLLSFRDVVTGDPLTVKMLLPAQGASSNAVDHLAFALLPGQGLLELALAVPPPTSTNTYLGALGMRDTNGIWQLQKLALHRPGPQKSANLVVDQPAVTVQLIRRVLRGVPQPKPDISVTLHEETRTWPIQGITISPRAVSSPARVSFNFERNVVLFLNGIPITNLTQSPTDPADIALRSIPAGGQAVLGMSFIDLQPGEYSLELKLLALNSKNDDKQQKVTVSIKTSDSMLPAIATLVIAMLVSFFAYKWLRVYQQSLGFQRRLAALRPPWLEDQPPIYSVVWLRTVLWQTEKLIRKILFVEPALITERIDKVTPVLDALNEARRARVAMRDLPQLVANRFGAVVSTYVRSMSDQDMDKAAAQKAKDTLSALNADLAAGRIADSYWTEVQKEVMAFFSPLSDKEVDSFRQKLDAAGLTPTGKTSVETVLATRKAPPKPVTLSDMMDYEQNYMKIKLLYERQSRDEFGPLVKAFEEHFQKTFDLADAADWELIKKTKPWVVAPADDGLSAHETYEPLRFEVTTGDASLNDSYLFHRGLKFKWHLELQQPGDKRQPKVYEPETLSPRIVHFSVKPGTLSVSARMVRDTPLGTEEKPVDAVHLSIEKSSDFKIFQHLERAEGWSLILAGFFAVISGLLTFYYKNPTFGSFQDYLMLFLWGVGVDQTKNFLQVMQSNNPNSNP